MVKVVCDSIGFAHAGNKRSFVLRPQHWATYKRLPIDSNVAPQDAYRLLRRQLRQVSKHDPKGYRGLLRVFRSRGIGCWLQRIFAGGDLSARKKVALGDPERPWLEVAVEKSFGRRYRPLHIGIHGALSWPLAQARGGKVLIPDKPGIAQAIAVIGGHHADAVRADAEARQQWNWEILESPHQFKLERPITVDISGIQFAVDALEAPTGKSPHKFSLRFDIVEPKHTSTITSSVDLNQMPR